MVKNSIVQNEMFRRLAPATKATSFSMFFWFWVFLTAVAYLFLILGHLYGVIF